jgi:hypothetical protein
MGTFSFILRIRTMQTTSTPPGNTTIKLGAFVQKFMPPGARKRYLGTYFPFLEVSTTYHVE